MAEQPFIFDIEDADTGKVYRVETDDPEATFDDAAGYLGSLPEEDWAQFEYQPVDVSEAQTPQVEPTAELDPEPEVTGTVSIAAPQLGSDLKRTRGVQLTETDYKLGIDDPFGVKSANKIVLNEQAEQTVIDMINYGDQPLEEVDKYLQDMGFAPADQATYEEWQKVRDTAQEGGPAANRVTYTNPFEGLNDSRMEEDVRDWSKDKDDMLDDGVLSQLGRGAVEAFMDPATFGGYLRRKINMAFNYRANELRERYPDLDDETFDELYERYVGWMQTQVAQASSEVTQDDNFWLNLAGQFIGSIPDPANVVPFGIAAKSGTRVGRAFEKAAEGAVVNAAVDVLYQNLAIQDYAQNGYQYERTFMSAGFGAAFSGLGQGVFDPRLAPRMSTDATRALNNNFPSFDDIIVPDARKGSKAYKEQMGQAMDGMLRGLETITEGWTNKPKIAVLYNFKGVRGVDNGAMGVYREDGSVLLNSEAVIRGAKKRGISVNDMLSAVTYHESLAHYGLNQLYGAELESKMLELYDNGNQQFRDQVDEWMAKRPEAYANLSEAGRLANSVEEVLAGWSERNGLLDRRVVDIATDWLKNMGRKAGLDIKYSLAEVRGILGTAQRKVTEGERVNPEASGGTKYIFGGPSQLELNMMDGQGNLEVNSEIFDDFLLTASQYESELARSTSPEDSFLIEQRYSYEGSSREATGWFKGPDDMWRFEISDELANLYEGGLPPLGETWKLSDVLYHPDLFDLYPTLADINIQTFESDRTLGSFYEGRNLITMNSVYQKQFEAAMASGKYEAIEEITSTLIHEIQHAVQGIEGFARGGSPDFALRDLPVKQLIKGSRNLARYIETVELEPLKTLRNTAEILRSSPEYWYLRQTNDIYDARYADHQRAQRVFGDGSPQEREAAKIWLESIEEKDKARREFHRLLGIDEVFITKDTLKRSGLKGTSQDVDDYFNLMEAIEDSSKIDEKIKNAQTVVKELKSRTDNKTKLTDKEEKELRDLLSIDKGVRHDAYSILFGEVEARDVQARLRYNKEQRKQMFPFLSEYDSIDPADWVITRPKSQAFAEAQSSMKEPETTSAGFRRRNPDSRSYREARKQFWAMKQEGWDAGVEAGGNPKYMRDDWDITLDDVSVSKERGPSFQADGKTVIKFIAKSPSGEVLATVRRRAFESNSEAEKRVKNDAIRNAKERSTGKTADGKEVGGVNRILSNKYMRDDWDPDSVGADDIIYAKDTEALFEAMTRNSPKESLSFEAIEDELLARGLSPSHVQRLAKTKAGSLTQRAGAFDVAMRKLDERRMRLHEQITQQIKDTGTIDPVSQVEMFNTYLSMEDIKDKAWGLSSELGRALVFTKRLAFTRRKTEAALQYFKEKGIDHLSDPQEFMKFMMEMEKDMPKTGKNQERYGIVPGVLSIDRNLMSLINVPRAIMSSMDLSAPLRQGVVFIGTGNYWKSFFNMFSMLGRSGKDNYDYLMRKIGNDPNYELMVQAKLAFSELDGKLSLREESFQTDLAQQIPGIGTIVTQSEQAYAGFLNKLRADMFNQYITQYKDTGIEINEELLQGLGQFINSATGRAQLPGGLRGASGLLNATFFSPRLIMSRVNMLNPVFYAKLPEPVRVEAFKNMLAFGTLATMFTRTVEEFFRDEATVESDPRSSEFGKINFDDTRFDVGGGFLGYLTMGARSVAYLGNSFLQSSERWTDQDTLDAQTHEIKSGTGIESQFSRGNDYGAREYITDGLIPFFRNKLSPQASFAWDMVSGTDGIGQPVTVEGSLMSRLVPMSLSDSYEAYKLKGENRALAVGSAVTFGASVSTYILGAYDKDQELKAPDSFTDNTLSDRSNEFVVVKNGEVQLRLPVRKMWKDTINNYFKYYVDAGIQDAKEQLGQPDLEWEDFTKDQKAYIIEWAKKDAQREARKDMKLFLEPYLGAEQTEEEEVE